MKFSYDKIADAIYIRAKSVKIKKTKRIHDDFIIDFDAKGNVRGIEILRASHWLDSKQKAPSVEIGNRKIPIPAFTH